MKLNSSISFGDRLAAAVMSAIVVGLMAIVLSTFVIFQRKRRLETLFQLYGTFPAWGSAVVLFAFAAGFVLGTERVTELLGHLWYTSEPRRPEITLTLWAVLVGVAVAGYLIFWYVL